MAISRSFTNGNFSKSITRTIAKQLPMFGQGYPVFFWAENGLVKSMDERPGIPEHKRYTVMEWQEAALRTLAISEMVIRSSEQGHYRDERLRLQQFVADMEHVIREAKMQGGGPTQGMKKRRAKTVVRPMLVKM